MPLLPLAARKWTILTSTNVTEFDTTPSETPVPSFADLGLSEEVLSAVADMGYTAPTPVQAASIPHALDGEDVLAAAQTGTGKTAAFLLPTMNNLPHVPRSRARGRVAAQGPLMLVVTPTRELAQQIEEVCRAIARRTGHTSVTVVGGVNMDIGGWPGEVPVMQDSNHGVVRMSLGGVGRNIAHNMSLLGLDVRMVTAFGDDLYAQKIAASCGELGIDISQSPVIPEGHTSTYLFINDEKGDMLLAVSDMDIYRHLTPQLLSQRQKLLSGSQVLVIDTNIPAESIAYLAENCPVPIFADPVSTAKAVKLQPVLGRLHTLKPNRIEAELLSGVAITDEASLRAAADALLATGLHRVFISLGGDGVFAADRSGERVHLPVLPAEMVNTTGGGHEYVAAISWADRGGADLTGTAKAGLAASAIAMEGAETINPAMSAEALKLRAGL